MAKHNNSNKRSIVQQSVAVEVAPEAVEATAPKMKMTREEWRALSPDEKRATRVARRANRPNPAPRLGKTIARMARQCDKVADMLRKDEIGVEMDAAYALVMARSALTRVVEAFAALPADWRPLGHSAVGTSKFGAGDFVQIAEKRRSSFVGLLEADEMLELRVVKVVGKKLVLQTEGGTRLVLPANIIVRQAA
jgi:hypothetical protein